MTGSLGESLRDGIAKLLAPLAALDSPQGISAMLASFGHGEDVAGDASLQGALTQVATAADALQQIEPETLDTWQGVSRVLQTCEEVFAALRAIERAVGDPAIAAQAANLGKQIADRLVALYLRAHHPRLHRAAAALTLLEPAELVVPSSLLLDGDRIVRMPSVEERLRFDRIGDLIADPWSVLRDFYMPNGLAQAADAHEAGGRLFPVLALALESLGLRSFRDLKSLDPPPEPEPFDENEEMHDTEGGSLSDDPLTPSTLPPLDPTPYLLRHLPRLVALFPATDASARLAVALVASSAEHEGGVAGMIGTVAGSLNWDETRGPWHLTATSDGEIPAFVFGPGGFTRAPAAVGGVTGHVRIAHEADTPAWLFGSAAGSRLELSEIRAGVDYVLTPERQEIALTLEADHAALVVAADGDGLLAALLPSGGLSVVARIGLSLSSDRGIQFGIGAPGASLSAEWAVDRSLGGLRLEAITRGLDPIDDERGSGLAATIGIRLSTRLGPVKVSLDGIGLGADLLWGLKDPDRAPNLGIVHLERIGFRPPRGIGIRIDAGFLKGGGFLRLDVERGEYAGAFEVTLFGFSLKIIMVLTTKVPNGAAPYALLAMVSARWPGGGAPLPLGFKLKAVGGMIGINHRFDYQTLVDALPNGALDDILFPDDPVGDAPRILSSLRAICPIAGGARTLALMAELGWGANYICTLRLGVVMPLDDLSRIYLIAQVKLVCFKDMPAALRLQLTCDAVGEICFNPFSLRIDARLRDSRFGAIGIQGQLVFLLKTGAESRLLIAAGGFHPNFKDVPAGLPRKIDRLAVVYEVGKLQAWVKGYFAVAAGTIQFGFDLGCRYKAGSLAFTGNFGIDALVHLKPFAFEAGFHFNAAIEYRGHELFGVHVNGTLWGPDRWRIKGRGEFSILFWDIGFNFDESWGDDVGVGDARIALAAQVDADLDDPTNWQFEVPAEARSLINFGGEETGGEALAHPLAALTYRQRRIPFGLQLDHVGSAEIEGRSLFPVPEMTDAADNKLPGGPVTDPFAVGEYVELDDEARLSRPSFEQLPSGVSAGAAGYRIDAARVVSVDVDYEQLFLPQKSRFNVAPFAELTDDFFAHILAREAAGRSPLRGRDRVARRRDPVRTVGPDWAAVDRATRAAAAPAAEEWANRASSAVASSAGKPGGMLVVEAFELAA